MSKKAAIAIDAWKLSIFDRHLKAAGYTYTHNGNADIIILKVNYEWLSKLKPIVEAANLECSNQ